MRRSSSLTTEECARIDARIAALPPLDDEQLDAVADVLVDIRLNPGGGGGGDDAA